MNNYIRRYLSWINVQSSVHVYKLFNFVLFVCMYRIITVIVVNIHLHSALCWMINVNMFVSPYMTCIHTYAIYGRIQRENKKLRI